MKKLLIAVLAAGIGFSSISGVSAADVPDEQWVLDTMNPAQRFNETLGLQIADDASAIPTPSELVASMDSNDQRAPRICKTNTDEFCGVSNGAWYVAILPPCDATNSINCISAVSAVVDGKTLTGSFEKKYPEEGWTDYPGDPAKNLPTGSSPSLWQIAGAKHGGGTEQYLVKFVATGNRSTKDGKFSIGNIRASISAATIKNGGFGRQKNRDGRDRDADCVAKRLPCGLSTDGNSSENTTACASIADGSCAIRQPFPANTRFKISAKLSQSPTGWFHGRMKSPAVELSTEGGVVNLSVEADPVNVPTVGIMVPRRELSKVFTDYYVGHYGGSSFGELGPNGYRNELSQPEPSSDKAFTEFAMWADYFKDKASANPGLWYFRTLELTPETGKCFRDETKLVGIVTTNAMMYSGGPPSFNQSEGTLDYKVGAPHYTSKGDVFKGTYDLQVRSDVARCLYGFSNAPIRATISITNQSGDANVATTTVSEDRANGWLKMAAYNFTFSSPTVKVKFAQDAEPTPTPTPTPSATAKAPVKSTITCIKGKSSKKVTAVNPKCPNGYKKKAA